MPRAMFATEILPMPEIHCEVPWDSELVGIGMHGDRPVMFWLSDQGVGHLVPKLCHEFYVVQLGDQLPDDHGELVGTCTLLVDATEIGPTGAHQHVIPANVAIWRKKKGC